MPDIEQRTSPELPGRQTSRQAWWALVCGVLAVVVPVALLSAALHRVLADMFAVAGFYVSLVLGPLAYFLGLRALLAIGRSPRRLRGNGPAIAGMACAVVAGLMYLGLVYVAANTWLADSRTHAQAEAAVHETGHGTVHPSEIIKTSP